MYDNIGKFLAKNFSSDLAKWLIGESIPLTVLEPTEAGIIVAMLEGPREMLTVSKLQVLGVS